MASGEKSWHPPKIPGMDTRKERLSYLLEKVEFVASGSDAAKAIRASVTDETVEESLVARTAAHAIVESKTSLGVALGLYLAVMEEATKALQTHGKGNLAEVIDADVDHMHRHVINLNTARATLAKRAKDDDTTALAFLAILVPIEGLLTDHLLKHNLSKLHKALAGIPGGEAHWKMIQQMVQLHDFRGLGLSLPGVVNGWRHANAYLRDGKYVHMDSPDRPLDSKDLAMYAEYGVAVWEASQIYFAILCSLSA